MLRRSSRILLEVVIGIMAGVVLLSGVTVWRLAQKPLNVDFLTPHLERALTGGESGFEAEVGRTVLAWNQLTRTLDLQAREVRLRDGEGFTVATLPEVTVNLNLRALVQGVVAPTEIDIIGARVTLIRSREGGFDFGQPSAEGERPDEEADFSIIVPALLAELLSEPDPARPLSFLKAARFLNGKLTIYDKKQRTFWHAPATTVSIDRTPGGLSGNMDLTLALGTQQADLGLTLLYREADASTILAASFEELAVEALAALDQRLSLLAGFDFPVSGGISAVLEADGIFKSFDFDLTGGPGTLSFPDYLPETLQVEELAFRGFLDGKAQSIEIETADLRFATNPELHDFPGPGPKITASGKARVVEGDVEIEVAGKAVGVPVDDLGRYWPPDLAASAREWVTTNIRTGLAEEAEIRAVLRVPSGELGALEVESLTGGYRYRDLDIHYLRPMPPVTGVSGSASFDADSMTFDVSTGRLGAIFVPGAAVRIRFDETVDTIKIDLSADGPLRDTLELLDHESLQLISELGIKPEDSSGEATAQVGFQFPLVNDLTFEQMQIDVKAKLSQVAVKQVFFERDSSHGELTLELDRSGMTVIGPLELGELPVDLKWRQNFEPRDGPSSIYEVGVARLDEQDLASFGLDLRPYLKGYVSAFVTMRRHADGGSFLETTLDLKNADLSLPFLEWRKQPDEEGQMRIEATLQGERPVALDRLEIRSGSLAVVGRGDFDDAGTMVTRLDLDELRFGRSRLLGVTVVRDQEGVDVELGNGVLDAAPFMASQGRAAESEGPEEEKTAFSVSARRLEAVTFGEDRHLEQVTLKLDRRQRGWEEMELRGLIPRSLWTEVEEPAESNEGHRRPRNILAEGADEQSAQTAPEPKPEEEKAPKPQEKRFIRLHYRPAAEGGYDLLVKSNDMGGVLRALDLRDTVRGGQLEIVGHSDGPIPKHTLSARIEAKDYTLVNATTLAKILTVASLTGLIDTLSGKGIWFDSLTGDFTLTDGLMNTELLHAYGSALGVTVKGDIDFDAAQLDLEGTVVPAYTVNRILGKIPGLGFILTGGEGGGIVAFTYGVEGSIDDPTVSVNPLSILAVGFLRGLFGGLNGENATVFPEGPNR